MKRQIKLYHSNSLREKLLDWNPQLFREIKGKLNISNVVITAAMSVIIQFAVVISLLGKLPKFKPTDELTFGRYGMGIFFGEGGLSKIYYTQDSLGDWVVNWQLLWLDLFIILSIIGTTSLLVVGTYLLIADLIREESRGTLNFIRQAPQSAHNILLGKVLGVPVLLYIFVLLLFPLHLMAGLKAQIPLGLLVGFDTTVVASCAFFYSLTLLWSLTKFQLSGFKSWFASGLVGSFLFITSWIVFNSWYISLDCPSSWLLLFNPNFVLSYIIDAASLPDNKYDFITIADLSLLKFYGQTLWTKAGTGIGFIIFNFTLGTYWSWSILKRRFHNPEYTLISKVQSYWITGWFTAIALGFTIQSYYQIDLPVIEQHSSKLISPSYLALNFFALNLGLLIFGLGLIAALTPQRQVLHDWARYRHQTASARIWKELIVGENSPATVAMAINLTLAVVYIIPSVFILLDRSEYYVAWGFVLIAGSITFYASIIQLILTAKSNKRVVWSTIAVSSAIFVPPVFLSIANISPVAFPQPWLFSFIPTIAVGYATLSSLILTVAGQWLAIVLLNFQLGKKLQRAEASETKMLFEQSRD